MSEPSPAVSDAPFAAPPRPGRRLSRAERQEARRDLLLAAAWDVIAETGWNKLTMEQVAERAGLSRRPIYTIFGSREDLLLALYDRLVRDQTDLTTRIPPGECLRHTLAAYAKSASEKRHLPRTRVQQEVGTAVHFIALSDTATREKVSQIHVDIFEQFTGWLQDCTTSANETFSLPIDRVSYALASAVFGVTTLACVSPSLITETAVTDTIMAFAPACTRHT